MTKRNLLRLTVVALLAATTLTGCSSFGSMFHSGGCYAQKTNNARTP